jgi:hypothetical protein
MEFASIYKRYFDPNTSLVVIPQGLVLKSVGATANTVMGAGVNFVISTPLRSKWGGVFDVDTLVALYGEALLCKVTISKELHIALSDRNSIKTTSQLKWDLFHPDNCFSASVCYSPTPAFIIGVLLQGSVHNRRVELGPLLKFSLPGPWNRFTHMHMSAGVDTTASHFLHLEAQVTSYFSEDTSAGAPCMSFTLSPLRRHEPFALTFQYNL